jgi:DNA end-binding protein Ku
MPHPVGSGLLSFGLVSIPVKLYSATSNHGPSFHFLHAKCGSRVRTQRFCPVCNKVVEREEVVRGYEYAKNEYVRFTDEELSALELEANSSIDLHEFVPLKSVDPVYMEGTYYLGPEKGGEKAYHLLGEAMRKTGRVAVAQYVARGKGYLALIRPFQDGLVMNTLYYADEIRNFDDIDKGIKPSEEEIQMGIELVEQHSSEKADLEKYEDPYRLKVLALVDSKVKGEELEAAPASKPRGQVIDLMEALKKSLAGKVGEQEKKREPTVKPAAVLSFNEFKEVFAELEVPEQSLRKSYQGLDRLRKNQSLSWHEVGNRVQTLRSSLERDSLHSTGKLKAARIPLTERDWERMG